MSLITNLTSSSYAALRVMKARAIKKVIFFIHKEFSVRTKLTSKLIFTDILRRKNFLMTKKIKKNRMPI